MIAAAHSHPGVRSLVGRLPEVRGRYTVGAALAPFTWFRVGGPAEVMFRPADRDDLCRFLGECPADVPVTVIGATSNLLVRDGGIPGVVIRLSAGFSRIQFLPGAIRLGAAVRDVAAARAALGAGRVGLEFLSGIPGTIGGGLRMNAGAYGTEFRDVLIDAEAVDPTGTMYRLTPDDMGMAYRHCAVPDDWIFTDATLRAEPGDADDSAARITDIHEARAASQPIRARTGGSTFANPAGEKAWVLIDRAGCRGLQVGGARVSELHCNFLVNTGDATAADLETLGEEVRRRVLEQTGVFLRWEIRRIGVTGESMP